jgi:hypothetical protein
MDLFSTVLIAFILFLIALALIAIGWLITGKMKVRIGSCGRAPKRDEECGGKRSCSLCEEEKKEKDDVQ